MYISTDREGNCLSYLWLMAPSSCEMSPTGFVFFLVSGCCMTVALYPGTLIQKGGRSSTGLPPFVCVPGMAQILLVKVQSRAFVAKCSEPQAESSNAQVKAVV